MIGGVFFHVPHELVFDGQNVSVFDEIEVFDPPDASQRIAAHQAREGRLALPGHQTVIRPKHARRHEIRCGGKGECEGGDVKGGCEGIQWVLRGEVERGGEDKNK